MGQLDFEYGYNDPDYNTHDPPKYDQACMGMLVCPHCAKAVICGDIIATKTGSDPDTEQDKVDFTNSYIIAWWVDKQVRNITQSLKEKFNSMDLGTHYDRDAKSGGSKYKRRPFLKAKDIAAKGSTAKVIDFREAPKQMEYSDFLMDVSIGKKEYTWGLRSKSVTLNMLIDELGKRTEKWIGKTIKLVRAGAKGQYINLGK